MEKEFIPYEQALKLKELRFGEPCFGFYGTDGHWYLQYCRNGNIFKRNNGCLSPTFSQIFRWFREKYNLFCEIQIDRTTDPKFFFDIYQYEHFGNYKEIRIGEWYLYRTYEEAELECLKKLIEIVKK